MSDGQSVVVSVTTTLSLSLSFLGPAVPILLILSPSSPTPLARFLISFPSFRLLFFFVFFYSSLFHFRYFALLSFFLRLGRRTSGLVTFRYVVSSSFLAEFRSGTGRRRAMCRTRLVWVPFSSFSASPPAAPIRSLLTPSLLSPLSLRDQRLEAEEMKERDDERNETKERRTDGRTPPSDLNLPLLGSARWLRDAPLVPRHNHQMIILWR